VSNIFEDLAEVAHFVVGIRHYTAEVEELEQGGRRYM
jgi:hypothetical protein